MRNLRKCWCILIVAMTAGCEAPALCDALVPVYYAAPATAAEMVRRDRAAAQAIAQNNQVLEAQCPNAARSGPLSAFLPFPGLPTASAG